MPVIDYAHKGLHYFGIATKGMEIWKVLKLG